MRQFTAFDLRKAQTEFTIRLNELRELIANGIPVSPEDEEQLDDMRNYVIHVTSVVYPDF